jgi:hypothetical protein
VTPWPPPAKKLNPSPIIGTFGRDHAKHPGAGQADQGLEQCGTHRSNGPAPARPPAIHSNHRAISYARYTGHMRMPITASTKSPMNRGCAPSKKADECREELVRRCLGCRQVSQQLGVLGTPLRGGLPSLAPYIEDRSTAELSVRNLQGVRELRVDKGPRDVSKQDLRVCDALRLYAKIRGT